MAYNKTLWVDNETDVNATNLNNLEDGVKTLDVEILEIKGSIAGKAAAVHEHAEIAALQVEVAGKALAVHTHEDLETRILAVESRPAGEATDLAPLTARVLAVEEALPGKAAADHTHAEFDGLGALDLAALTARVVTLETSMVSVISRLDAVEAALSAGGEGHTHAELEAMIVAIEEAKAPKIHTHEASDIVTSRA